MERIEKLPKNHDIFIIWENEWDKNINKVIEKIEKIKKKYEI